MTSDTLDGASDVGREVLDETWKGAGAVISGARTLDICLSSAIWPSSSRERGRRSNIRLRPGRDVARGPRPDDANQVASNTEVFEHVWLAFSKGRADDVAEHLHPAVEWHSAMLDEVFRGPGAARRWIATLSHEWKSLTVVLDEVRALGGDCVVAVGTSTAFDYGGEQQLDRSFAWVTEYAGERIVRSLIFGDVDEAEAYVASRRAAA